MSCTSAARCVVACETMSAPEIAKCVSRSLLHALQYVGYFCAAGVADAAVHAGHSYARHADRVPHSPPSHVAHYHTEVMHPWVGYAHPTPPALHPSVPLAACPWLSASGSYAVPAPAGTSFAQSMPPPGTLPFTMGSEPIEAPTSSRRAAVAATAMNPARFRGRTRSRGARVQH